VSPRHRRRLSSASAGINNAAVLFRSALQLPLRLAHRAPRLRRSMPPDGTWMPPRPPHRAGVTGPRRRRAARTCMTSRTDHTCLEQGMRGGGQRCCGRGLDAARPEAHMRTNGLAQRYVRNHDRHFEDDYPGSQGHPALGTWIDNKVRRNPLISPVGCATRRSRRAIRHRTSPAIGALMTVIILLALFDRCHNPGSARHSRR